jgi:hypothetical protein
MITIISTTQTQLEINDLKRKIKFKKNGWPKESSVKSANINISF